MIKDSLLQRIVIENVHPSIDNGRYAAKRCVGDRLNIQADIFTDGHDLIDAEILYLEPERDHWHAVPLTPLANDRWQGSFDLERNGRYCFVIKAWPDVFGTWLQRAQKLLAAGEPAEQEMAQGRKIFEELLAGIQKIKQPSTLLKEARRLITAGKPVDVEKFLVSEAARELYRHYNPKTNHVVSHTLSVWADRKRAEFSAWYEMFPRSQGSDPTKSATFADCEKRLPDIRDMGFNVLYLPPIHPIGLSHRKGRNNATKAQGGDPGSPYAIGAKTGGHKSIHPQLGTIKDFRKFVRTANKLGLEVALDYAVQVSVDHPYIKEHPEWFSFRPDGTLQYAENPPKKYQDIANVNFAAGESLWEELKSIVQFWIEQGVTIFRVDNPHTKPFAFWEWLIDAIHEERPDILFLSEAFTRPKPMYLLAKAGFSQSYSYFTWRNTKQELTDYLTELTQGPVADFFRPNFFPTTPDIFPYYLHKGQRAAFIVRAALAATLGGNYGIYSGYELCEGASFRGGEEYQDSEKYEIKVRDWNAPGNIKGFLRQLNSIRQENPALQQFRNLRFLPADNGNVLFYAKASADGKNIVCVAINLDPDTIQQAHIELPLAEWDIDPRYPFRLDDLLLGHSWEWTGTRQHQYLDPRRNPVAIFRIHRS